ncbi:hypothetical protein LOTGIDRAFT_234476, partial [Lottia gigantea]
MLSIRVLGVFAVIVVALVLVESDVEHCEDDVNVCDGELPANAVCSGENNKTKQCQCKKGYEMSLDIDCKSRGSVFSCQDIDECATNNGLCEDKCQNEPGSYNCSCPEGSELQENGLNCGPGPCMFEKVTATGLAKGFNRIYISIENETECEKKCNTTAECTDWLHLGGSCRNYGLPIIQIEYFPNKDLDKCKKLCAENKKCVTFYYSAICTLFDTKQTEFDDDDESSDIFHKIDMNCI